MSSILFTDFHFFRLNTNTAIRMKNWFVLAEESWKEIQSILSKKKGLPRWLQIKVGANKTYEWWKEDPFPVLFLLDGQVENMQTLPIRNQSESCGFSSISSLELQYLYISEVLFKNDFFKDRMKAIYICNTSACQCQKIKCQNSTTWSFSSSPRRNSRAGKLLSTQISWTIFVRIFGIQQTHNL